MTQYQILLLKALKISEKEVESLLPVFVDATLEGIQIKILLRSVIAKIENGDQVKIDTNLNNFPDLAKLTKRKDIADEKVDNINNLISLFYNIEDNLYQKILKASNFVNNEGNLENSIKDSDFEAKNQIIVGHEQRILEYKQAIKDVEATLEKLKQDKTNLEIQRQEFVKLEAELKTDGLI